MSRQSTVLSSATQYAMHPKFDRKWGTECFNTRFSLPILLCAGYSVKLIYCINSKLKRQVGLVCLSSVEGYLAIGANESLVKRPRISKRSVGP